MKIKKATIKYIIFDNNGVLQLSKYDENGFNGHHTLSFHKYVSEKLGLDLDEWIDAMDTPYTKSIKGKISEKEVLNIISKNLNLNVLKLRKIILEGYKKSFKENRELFKIAFRLKKQGYKIGILSDQWYLSKEALIPKKVLENFYPVIISCDVKIRKPNPKIYKFLIKKSRCKANEILFIDNKDWNLKPAGQLGIKTLLFKNNKQLVNQLKNIEIKK